MRTRWITMSLIGIGLAGFGCQSHNGGEKKETEDKQELSITADQLPAPVKDTMQRESGNANLTEIKQETDDGKTCYEGHAMMNGKNYEIKVAADGTLLKKKLETEKKEGDKDKKEDGEKHEDKD